MLAYQAYTPMVAAPLPHSSTVLYAKKHLTWFTNILLVNKKNGQIVAALISQPQERVSEDEFSLPNIDMHAARCHC